MPEASNINPGCCKLTVYKREPTAKDYSPYSDFLLRGRFYKFVIQVADQESYDWIGARAQAIKENLLAQEEQFDFLYRSTINRGSCAMAVSATVLMGEPIRCTDEDNAFERGFLNYPINDLLDPGLLLVKPPPVDVAVSYIDDDGTIKSAGKIRLPA